MGERGTQPNARLGGALESPPTLWSLHPSSSTAMLGTPKQFLVATALRATAEVGRECTVAAAAAAQPGLHRMGKGKPSALLPPSLGTCIPPPFTLEVPSNPPSCPAGFAPSANFVSYATGQDSRGKEAMDVK